jgi:hypothetical protein
MRKRRGRQRPAPSPASSAHIEEQLNLRLDCTPVNVHYYKLETAVCEHFVEALAA